MARTHAASASLRDSKFARVRPFAASSCVAALARCRAVAAPRGADPDRRLHRRGRGRRRGADHRASPRDDQRRGQGAGAAFAGPGRASYAPRRRRHRGGQGASGAPRGAAGSGHRRRAAHLYHRGQRTHPRRGAGRQAPRHAARRARHRPGADGAGRACGRNGGRALRRHARARHRAHPLRPLRTNRRVAAARHRARALAWKLRAYYHARHHHRLRAPDPRLRLSLAIDARARGRHDLRAGAHAVRHRAQSRALRAVGLGPGARAYLLVGLHVRDSRTGAARRASVILGSRRPRAPRGWAPLRYRDAARRRFRRRDRPRLPHAARQRRLGLAARPRPARALRRRRQPAPDRDRGRQHRAAQAGGAHRHRRHAAARRGREYFRGLRAVGRREPPGAVQFQVSAAARTARGNDGARHGLRGRARGRTPADRAHRRSNPTASPRKARAPTRRSSPTAAGSRSANGAPRTAAWSRSAPRSPRSSATKSG